MTKSRQMAVLLLHELFSFILLYVIFTVPISIIAREPYALIWLLFMMVPHFITVMIRLRISNFVIFVALHIALVASMFFIPISTPIKETLIFFALSIAIYSMVKRLSKKLYIKDGPSLLIFAFAVVMVANQLSRATVEEFNIDIAYALCAFTLIIVHLLYMQISSLDASLSLIAQNDDTPVAKIIKFNNTMLSIFLVIASVAILCSLVLRNAFGIVVSAIGDFFKGIFRFIFSLRSKVIESPPEYVPPETESVDPLDQILPYVEVPQQSAFDIALQNVVYYVVFIIIIAGAIALIAFAIFNAYKKFSVKEKKGDIKEFIAPEITIVSAVGIRKVLQSIFTRETNNQKIRKIYSKKVNSYVEKGVKLYNSDTPTEISSKILQESNTAIDSLTETYKKARYSQHEISNDEVALCRKSIKSHP